MKLAILEDLHLPYHKNALQYEALRFYLEDIKKSGAEALIVPGDFTADGNKETAIYFLEALAALPIPSVIMTGNADYRDPKTRAYFRSITSPPKRTLGAVTVLALRDGEGEIPEADLSLLSEVDEKALIFLHHPIDSLAERSREALRSFRASHPKNPIFVGHAHIEKIEEKVYYLNAADRDKAIGMPPCVYYYDTESGVLSKTSFPVSMPEDIPRFVGISAFRPLEDLAYAAERRLYAVEFRPSVISVDREALLSGIRVFREAGGKCISFHFPNIAERDGSLAAEKSLLEFSAFASACGANRVTVHAPSVPLKMLKADPSLLPCIADLAAKALAALPKDCTVGVENMHMAADDTPEDRRFGYTPEECKTFIEMLRARIPNPVGFHFDTGHARNNIPLSQVYTQSVWMAALGREAVGYHIHQVILENGKFQNHMPITEPYGALISYATFFSEWERGGLGKAPIFLEIRPTAEDSAPYKKTLSWLMADQ